MASAAHHPLLDGPGIGPDAQHFQIVIGFEKQKIGLAQVDAQRVWNIAQVGGDGDFDAVRRKRVAHRVCRIVRDSEAGHVEIADGEAATRLEGFGHRWILTPVDVRHGPSREVDRDEFLAGARSGAKATGVIAVLVRDQNGIQRADIFADSRQALGDFAAAEPSINEYARPVCRDERGVAGTAARKNANFNDGLTPDFLIG